MQYESNPANGFRDIVRKRNTDAQPDMMLTIPRGRNNRYPVANKKMVRIISLYSDYPVGIVQFGVYILSLIVVALVVVEIRCSVQGRSALK